jgi:2'-5' RNA ligase
MLVHLLTGEAKAYHTELSDHLASRFHVRKVSDDIDPHFTLKAPFETEQVEEIQDIVSSFVQKEAPEAFTLGGINNFGGKVIYMDAKAPKQTHMLIQRLQDQLKAVSWLHFYPTEFPVTLHATLCYGNNKQHGAEILAYLKKLKIPEFECTLDHVALMERHDRWEVVERYNMKNE